MCPPLPRLVLASALVLSSPLRAVESLPQPLAEWVFDRIEAAPAGGRQIPGGGLLAVPASVTGNVEITADKFGKSVMFSPQQPGFLTLPVDLNKHLNGIFTVVTWVRLQAKQDDNGTIFRTGGAFTLRVQHAFLNLAVDNDWKAILTGSSTQLIGGWSMLAAVNSGNEITLYLDGVEIARHAMLNIRKFDPVISVGGRPPMPANPNEKGILDIFNGSIRSITIYNVALSVAQLKALLQAANPAGSAG